MAYAENEFYLSSKEKGFEATNREILTRLEKTTKQPQKELIKSRNPPKTLYHVWEWFLELYNGSPLSYNELLSWSTLRQVPLERYESKLLVDLSKIPCQTT